jgi:hypothetical protein
LCLKIRRPRLDTGQQARLRGLNREQADHGAC